MADNSDLEREGVASAERAIRRHLRWTFRDQAVDDYGIDAHVEPKRDGVPTGKLIAAQIKAGTSYFRDEAPDGWYYTGNDRHLRYWLNHVLPVVVILYDPGTETCYWQHVTGEHITYTATGWKLLVPASQILSADAGEPLLEIAESVPGASADPLAAALDLLPPTAAVQLAFVDKTEPGAALRLGWLLARGSSQPAMTIQSLLAAQPSWWEAGKGRLDVALAAYAAEHGYPALAAEALARAVAASEEPSGKLYANAAHFAALAGDHDRARQFLQRAEDVGSYPLLCAIARAVAAHAGQRGLVDVPDAVTNASAEQLAAEPAALLFLGEQAIGRRDYRSAADYLGRACELVPDASSAALAFAHALMGRIITGKAVVAGADLRRAEDLAVSALRQRRRWAGPSGEALAALIRLRMLTGAYATALRMATPASLGGDAPDREAAHEKVAVLGADAAMTLGDRQRAAQFAGQVTGTWAELLIRALTADPDSPIEDRITLWRHALAMTLPPQEHMVALSHLAGLGAWPLPELDELEAAGAIDATDRDILTARSEAARGLTDDAVRRLRPHVTRKSAAAEILIDVLTDARRYSQVAEECDRAIGRFGGDAIFVHKKLNALALSGQHGQAAALAAQILASPATPDEVRIALRRRLASDCAARQDWVGVEEQCSAALTDGCTDTEMQWGLIGARYNQGNLEAAWSRLQELQPAVTDPVQAQLWTALHARFGFTLTDVSAALEFSTRWPDDPDLPAGILGTLLNAEGARRPDGRPVLPELDPVTLHSLDTALKAFTTRYPAGPIQVVSQDTVSTAAILRDRTIIHAARVDVAAAQVRAGQLPLAALAMVADWTYTQVLAHAGGGFIPAVTNSPQEFEAEISAAKTSIGRPVVIELSALAVATSLPGRWPSLVAAFTELKLTRAAAADLHQGCQDLMRAPGTILSVGYDPSSDNLVSNQLSPAEWQYLARRASELTDAARDATITGNPRPAHFPDGRQPPWVTSVELAAQAEIPLWSDDVVIRALAASQDIPAFGTLALLHALIEDNTLPDTLRTDVQALSAARVVDLTLTPDELLRLAAADGWQPTAAATVVTRPAYWASYQPALDTFLQLIGNVSSHAPAAIPAWLTAACHGLAASIPAADIPARLADLAHATAASLYADTRSRATLVQIAHDVAYRYGSGR